MAIKGKLLGGMIGCALGPWGALAGAGVGHLFDAAHETLDPHRAVLRALSGIAQSNGPITPKERRFLEQFIRLMFSEISSVNQSELLEETIKKPASPKKAVSLLKDQSPEIIRMVLFNGLSIAGADGGIDDHESNWIIDFAERAGLPPEEVGTLFDLFNRTNSQRRRQIAALEQLGLQEGASEAAIRSAYRKLANDYHPDKLTQIPANIRALAEDKMKQLNAAYRILQGGDEVLLEELEGWSLDDQRLQSGRYLTGGQVVKCLCCGMNNRLPPQNQILQARCGQCFVYLLLPDEVARRSEWIKSPNKG
jgi:DnaJ-domain-containing protein 1